MFFEAKCYEYMSLEKWVTEKERDCRIEKSFFFQNLSEASQFLKKRAMEELNVENLVSLSVDKNTVSSCSFDKKKNTYLHLFVELSERHFER